MDRTRPWITHPELTDRQYVTLLYSWILHREPDAAGFAGKIKELSNGVSRYDIFMTFINSAEFREVP